MILEFSQIGFRPFAALDGFRSNLSSSQSLLLIMKPVVTTINGSGKYMIDGMMVSARKPCCTAL
jgi:hypothetical protein